MSDPGEQEEIALGELRVSGIGALFTLIPVALWLLNIDGHSTPLSSARSAMS